MEGSANYSLHLFPKWPLLHKNSLEGSANCALHLSPSLLRGPKLRELLTCLTNTNPVGRKRPIMSLLWGLLWVYLPISYIFISSQLVVGFSGENRQIIWTSLLDICDHQPDDMTSEGISPKEVSRENCYRGFLIFILV